MTRLVPGSDPLYAWMLGEPPPATGLRLPPGGVAERAVLELLRKATAEVRAAHGGGDWLIVEDDEVVGLCSLKAPADVDGKIEIGYGIAASRQGRGHATRAVAAMLKEIARDPKVRSVTAETAAANLPSQRVLEANGFSRCGTRTDAEDGEVVCWRLDETRAVG